MFFSPTDVATMYFSMFFSPPDVTTMYFSMFFSPPDVTTMYFSMFFSPTDFTTIQCISPCSSAPLLLLQCYNVFLHVLQPTWCYYNVFLHVLQPHCCYYNATMYFSMFFSPADVTTMYFSMFFIPTDVTTMYFSVRSTALPKVAMHFINVPFEFLFVHWIFQCMTNGIQHVGWGGSEFLPVAPGGWSKKCLDKACFLLRIPTGLRNATSLGNRPARAIWVHWQMEIRWFHGLPSGSLPNTSANSLSLQTAGGSQSGRKKARSICTQSPLWQPRACSHDAWAQRDFRLHSRPTAQPICSKSCPFLIVGLPHPEDIWVRACFWIMIFCLFFLCFLGFPCLAHGFWRDFPSIWYNLSYLSVIFLWIGFVCGMFLFFRGISTMLMFFFYFASFFAVFRCFNLALCFWYPFL